MDNKLGETIINLRKEKGLTQEKMAELLEVSRQTISRWENGTVQPSNENIILLCEKLEIDREVLFSETACTSVNSPCVSNNDKPFKKRIDINLIGIIVFSILIIIMITWTSLVGLITFTSNTGDLYDNSDSIDKYVFYILLAVTLILVIADIISIIVRLKNLKVNKM